MNKTMSVSELLLAQHTHELLENAKMALDHLPSDEELQEHLDEHPGELRITVAFRPSEAAMDMAGVPADERGNPDLRSGASVDVPPLRRAEIIGLLRGALNLRVAELEQQLRDLGIDTSEQVTH